MAANTVIEEWLSELGDATANDVHSAMGIGALVTLAERLAAAQPKDREEVLKAWAKGLGNKARTVLGYRIGVGSMKVLVCALVKASQEDAPDGPVEAKTPTMADVVGVFDRRTARAIDAKLEAFRREQADALDRNAVSGFLQQMADATGQNVNARALGLGIYVPHPGRARP